MYIDSRRVKSLTCPPPHRNLPGWFQAASLQGWSLPASSVQSWPHPSLATPGGAQRGTLPHICSLSDHASYCENLSVEQCAHHVEESHHRNNWSRAHVGYESTEEGPGPQVPVVFPKKLLWGLVYKHTHDRLMDNTVVHGSHQNILETQSCSRHTCTSFSPTSLKPFFSKRRTISPTSLRCTPSGFTATKVRSFTPVQPRVGENVLKLEFKWAMAGITITIIRLVAAALCA